MNKIIFFIEILARFGQKFNWFPKVTLGLSFFTFVGLNKFDAIRNFVCGALLLIIFVWIIKLAYDNVFMFNTWNVPSGEKISNAASNFSLTRACEEDLEWIFSCEKDFYSPQYRLSLDKIKEWYSISNNLFYILLMSNLKDRFENRNRVGYLVLLPLRDYAHDDLYKGSVSEQQLSRDSILLHKDRVKFVFIESITICVKDPYLYIRAFHYIVHNFMPLLDNVCNVNHSRFIYCLPSNARKREMMISCCFDVDKREEKTTRKDGLVVLRFNKSKFDNFLNKGDNMRQNFFDAHSGVDTRSVPSLKAPCSGRNVVAKGHSRRTFPRPTHLKHREKY